MITDKSILINYGGKPLEALPPELRRRVESRPRLLEAFQAQARVASMMALKRHEQPEEALSGRLSYALVTRIRNHDFPLPDQPGLVLPEWARMVAVVVFMLGLSVFTHREMLSSESSGPVPLASTASTEAPTLVNLENDSYFIHHNDPFLSHVSLASERVTPFPEHVNRQIRDSFDYLTLMQTNRTERLPLLPVRQSLP